MRNVSAFSSTSLVLRLCGDLDLSLRHSSFPLSRRSDPFHRYIVVLPTPKASLVALRPCVSKNVIIFAFLFAFSVIIYRKRITLSQTDKNPRVPLNLLNCRMDSHLRESNMYLNLCNIILAMMKNQGPATHHNSLEGTTRIYKQKQPPPS